jgi:transposase-like protein
MPETINFTNQLFSDEDKARAWFESQRWPDGVICPHCGSLDEVKPCASKAHGPGWYHCNACRDLFTVRVGSVMERSHIPLTKWALVFHLMAASKKGVSAKQVQRMCGFKSYKSAWFMCHRIREAMKPDAKAGPLGGSGKVLESDETFVGGKAKNAHKNKPIPKKHAVHALVERDGLVSASHVPDVTAKTLGAALEKVADRRSTLNTDDSLANLSIGKAFAEHRTVAHTLGEYVTKDGAAHTQTVESFFAIIKRGVTGSFHSISEQHLQRYVEEFAFRWNNRSALGIEDTERANRMVKGAVGRRLTYRKADTPLADEGVPF